MHFLMAMTICGIRGEIFDVWLSFPGEMENYFVSDVERAIKNVTNINWAIIEEVKKWEPLKNWDHDCFPNQYF